MNRLTRDFRRFALAVLFAVAWVMPAIAGATAGAPDKLQVLVNDTAAQLQLAYRQHPDERARRQEQLTAAVGAWRAAPRNEANNERLANWLREAIMNSMPGSQEPMPALPSFAAPVKAAPQPETHEAPLGPEAAEVSIENKAPVESVAKPAPEREDDPFRDDPVNDDEQE